MPVVVTGAAGFIGRRAVAAFVQASPEVRAYVRRRESADDLRALGAKVAVGPIAEVDTLEAVMRDAHTVCHLVGGLNLPDERAYQEGNLDSVLAVLEAASRAGVRRVLFLSYPGASPEAGNAFLRSKGLAEKAIEASGLEHVILRTTLVCGPGSEWLDTVAGLAGRWPSVVVGTGRQMTAPVFVDDVAAILAAADDRRLVRSGTWGLEGPDKVTADGLVDLIGPSRGPRVHLKPGGPTALVRMKARGASRTALEVLAADSLADAPSAAAEFGVARTPLTEALARWREGLPDAVRPRPQPE